MSGKPVNPPVLPGNLAVLLEKLASNSVGPRTGFLLGRYWQCLYLLHSSERLLSKVNQVASDASNKTIKENIRTHSLRYQVPAVQRCLGCFNFVDRSLCHSLDRSDLKSLGCKQSKNPSVKHALSSSLLS